MSKEEEVQKLVKQVEKIYDDHREDSLIIIRTRIGMNGSMQQLLMGMPHQLKSITLNAMIEDEDMAEVLKDVMKFFVTREIEKHINPQIYGTNQKAN